MKKIRKYPRVFAPDNKRFTYKDCVIINNQKDSHKISLFQGKWIMSINEKEVLEWVKLGLWKELPLREIVLI